MDGLVTVLGARMKGGVEPGKEIRSETVEVKALPMANDGCVCNCYNGRSNQ
jgi:hypothetical protein